MSAPNISLLNATYSAVSGVTLPKSGGGTATFPWVEGSETKTQNGTYDVTTLAQLVVNVSGGGGGLEYETGTFTLTESITRPTITFANAHTTTPMFVMVADATSTYDSTTNTYHADVIYDWSKLGATLYPSSSATQIGDERYYYRASNTSQISGGSISISNSSSLSGRLTNTYFKPGTGSTRKYITGRTYKWIAVWAPT